MFEEQQNQTRSWNRHARAAWWVKYLGGIATGLIALAGICKMLGLQFDVQTKTEARTQHEEIRKEVSENQEKATQRVEKAIDKLGDRIDSIVERQNRRPR